MPNQEKQKQEIQNAQTLYSQAGTGDQNAINQLKQMGVVDINKYLAPTPTVNNFTPNPIDAQIIKETTGQYNPPTPPSYTNTGIAVGATANNAPTTTPTQPEQTQTQKDRATLSTYIQGLLGRDTSKEINKITEKANLIEKEQAKNKVYNSILATKKSYEDQIKEIEKNKEGKFGGALQQDIDELRRKANDELANLSIQYQVLNDDYQGAEKILNAQIQDIQDSFNNQLKTFQIAQDFLSNDLTDSEKVAIQNQQDLLKQQAANDEYRARANFDAQLQQADPLYKAKLQTEILQGQKISNEINTTGTNANNYQIGVANRTVASVDNLINKAIANPEIFGRSAALPIPDFARSDAFRNFKAQLETLKANVFTSQLQAMREASKTGGAVGNVSDKEGDRFANALGAISMSQSPDEIQKQLVIIKDSTIKWLQAVGGETQSNQNSGKTVTSPTGEQVIITDY